MDLSPLEDYTAPGAVRLRAAHPFGLLATWGVVGEKSVV